MEKTARELSQEISALSDNLRSRTSQLAFLQKSCKHDFGTIVYDPIICEGYTHPGDPPGTMGVDWRPPQYIPGSTTKRWRRKCTLCDLTQETQRTKTQNRAGSVAGTTSTEEVPDFS